MTRSSFASGLLLLSVAVSACGSDDAATPAADAGSDAAGAPPRAYSATIRRTSYGIPHVKAKDYPSAAFGLGWVGAGDYGCILLDQIVKVRSEWSKFHGPGPKDANIQSDFGILNLRIRRDAHAAFDDLSDELRGAVEGYAAGFNHYLDQKSLAKECEGEPWARAIDPRDLAAYYYWLAQLASGQPLLLYIGKAQPPVATPSKKPKALQADELGGLSAAWPRLSPRPDELGSNGWALGKDVTESGGGMLLANPHFPWEGNLRFHENHVTVDGEVDVYGASLVGAPVVNIGFNAHVAWTHTVTTARHMTLYLLHLVDGDPTSYLVDGKPRKMKSEDFEIEVKGASGKPEKLRRTLWWSHHGPIVQLDPLGGWTKSQVVTMRNANEKNFAVGEQWYRMDRAKSIDDILAINEEVHGIPWVNTMAADAAGNTLYIDASRTPKLSDKAIAKYRDNLENDAVTKLVNQSGATIFDGSDPLFEWKDVVSIARSPTLRRTDYVFNSNDSYWLTNPEKPLTGYSPLFGDERTERSARTRMNLLFLTEEGPDSARGADGKWSLDDLLGVPLSNRASYASLLRESVVERCQDAKKVTLGGAKVDVMEVCAAIEAWDGRLNPESQGAIAWRECIGAFLSGAVSDEIYAEPFDADDPVATPRGLVAPKSGEPDPVLLALAHATQTLADAGVSPSAKLGDVQFAVKSGKHIGIPGGLDAEGAFNVISYGRADMQLRQTEQADVLDSATGLTQDGYIVNSGSSFVMGLEFAKGKPRAKAILTYSESADPDSPHFDDQTKLWSQKKFHDVLFDEADIANDPELSTETVGTN